MIWWTLTLVMGCSTSATREAPAPAPAAAPAPTPEATAAGADAEGAEGGQTFAQGVAALCSAWQTCPNCQGEEAARAAFNLNRHIEKVVTHRDVLKVFYGWGAQSREARGESLKAAVDRAELADCALMAMFENPVPATATSPAQ